MEFLLALLALGMIVNNSARSCPAADRPVKKFDDLFQPAVEFSPVDTQVAVRAGTPCWVCGKERDGHQHI
jgi:hypothetical protein